MSLKTSTQEEITLSEPTADSHTFPGHNHTRQGCSLLVSTLSSTCSGQHPFSALVELEQKALLGHLLYLDEGFHDQHWTARIDLSCKVLNIRMMSIDGHGQSKKDAKKAAAAQIVVQLIRGAEHGFDEPQARPLTRSVSTVLRHALRTQSHHTPTRKQKKAFLMAQHHLEVLQQMSVSYKESPDQCITLLAVDLEWYESGAHELLEVGLSWVARSRCLEPNPPISSHHFVIRDYYDVRNGRYVPDNKDQFNFGCSEMVNYEELGRALRQLIEMVVVSNAEVVLIGHSVQSDLAVFERLGMSDTLSQIATRVCDVALAYQALQGHQQLSRLSRILDHYEIPFEHLHNAANDAYYTLSAFARMMAKERSGYCEGSRNLCEVFDHD